MIVQIYLREGYDFSEKQMLLFIKTLQGYRPEKKSFAKIFSRKNENFRFTIDCDSSNKVSFFFEVLNGNEDAVLNSLRNFLGTNADVILTEALPKYEFIQTLFYEPIPIDYDKDHNIKKVSTLKRFDASIPEFMITSMKKRTRIILEFSVTALPMKELAKNTDEMLNHSQFNCSLYTACKTKYQLGDLTELSNSIQNLTQGSGKLMVKYKLDFKPFKASSMAMLNLFSFPSIDEYERREIHDKIYTLSSAQKTLVPGQFDKGIKFGTNAHPKQVGRDIRVNLEQLKKHLLITGMTGAGKSSAFEEMAKDIIYQKLTSALGVGFIYFDPAETSALGVINIIRKFEHDGHDISELLKKVHYIDFNQDKYVFSINLLDKNIDNAHLLRFIKELFGDGTQVQVDRNMMNLAKALLQDTENHVITDVLRVLNDSEYAMELADRLESTGRSYEAVEYLRKHLPKGNEVTPILNRIDPFKNSLRIQRIFQSGYNDLKDVRKWMDEGHIVIVNVASMGDFEVKAIIEYMELQLYTTCLKRPDFSNSFFELVDEGRKLQSSTKALILSEGRKKGLHLGFMTQFLDQLNTDFLSELLGNVATIISMRQSDQGAMRLLKNTDLGREAYKGLKDRSGFIYTYDSGKFQSVMFEARPPLRYKDGELIDITKLSDEKFQKQTSEIMDSDRQFAHEVLMARDYKTVKEIDQIIYPSRVRSTYNDEADFLD